MFSKKFIFIAIAGIYGMSAIILAAMSSHAFELNDKQQALFHHVVVYLLIHALLLLWLANHLSQSFLIGAAAWAVVFGVLLFCGGLSLYIFAGKTTIAWITPIGGSLMILAWLNLVIFALQRVKNHN